MDRIGIAKETSTMIWGGVYPGMIVATISTALFVALVATSIVIVRRRLDYRAWYAVHFTAYTAIALGWFHQTADRERARARQRRRRLLGEPLPRDARGTGLLPAAR